MLDFIWRLLGYELDKDVIRSHQLARAKKWSEDQKVKKAEKVVEDAKPSSFSRCVIENSPKNTATTPI